jgi:hypothetical protein
MMVAGEEGETRDLENVIAFEDFRFDSGCRQVDVLLYLRTGFVPRSHDVEKPIRRT